MSASLRRRSAQSVACLLVLSSLVGTALADDDEAKNRTPVASFTVTPTAPQTNQTVTFTSTSSDPDGTIASQAWDLDNDGSYDDGTGRTASRSFATPGTYTVRLRVVDNRGASKSTSRDVVVANRPPVASFTWSPAAPTSGESVTFTSTSSDPDGTIASQAWDLDNDGSFDDGTGKTASRSFLAPGTYAVRLKVIDNRGAEHISSREVTIANRSPAASFTWSPAEPQSGEEVTFTSTSSDPDGTVAGQAWDLDGDGEYDDAAGAEATQTFATPGDHQVGLRVVDDRGADSTKTETVRVGNRGPAVRLVLPATPAVAGETTTLTAEATDPDGRVQALRWDLDADGAFDDGEGSSVHHSFPAAGGYVVAVEVEDDAGAKASAFETVEVADAPPSSPGGTDADGDGSSPQDDDTPLPPVRIVDLPGAPAWLDPFPVVRIRGVATARGARLTLVTVRGPVGAAVRVRCLGRSCPRTSESRRIGGSTAGLVRLRRFERTLRAGAVLNFSVTRRGMVGKHTRFVIRRMKPPVRTNRCLVPGSRGPAACPPR